MTEENNRYRKDIPAARKLEMLRAVWNGEKSVEDACRELGVSRQTYYQWKAKAEAALAKTLEHEKEGRKPNGHVEDEALRQELERLRARERTLEKEKNKLAREKEMAEKELWSARKIVEVKIATGQLDLTDKKNAALLPMIKRLFSITPVEWPR